MNLLSLINPSLANIYCSTTLSNYNVIRLKRFVSQFTCKLYNCFFRPHLMLYACVQPFDLTFLGQFFLESKHSLSKEKKLLQCYRPKVAEFSSKIFLQTSNFFITSKLSYIHKLPTFHHIIPILTKLLILA